MPIKSSTKKSITSLFAFVHEHQQKMSTDSLAESNQRVAMPRRFSFRLRYADRGKLSGNGDIHGTYNR